MPIDPPPTSEMIEIKLLIARMEAKGLDPTKLYDLKHDKIVDLVQLLRQLSALNYISHYGASP